MPERLNEAATNVYQLFYDPELHSFLQANPIVAKSSEDYTLMQSGTARIPAYVQDKIVERLLGGDPFRSSNIKPAFGVTLAAFVRSFWNFAFARNLVKLQHEIPPVPANGRSIYLPCDPDVWNKMRKAFKYYLDRHYDTRIRLTEQDLAYYDRGEFGSISITAQEIGGFVTIPPGLIAATYTPFANPGYSALDLQRIACYFWEQARIYNLVVTLPLREG